MTLTTEVRILDPIHPDRVWVEAKRIVGAGENPTYRWSDSERDGVHTRFADLEQGLPALMWMRWHGDGPLPLWDEDMGPVALVSLHFDTPYSYEVAGENCSMLHRRLTGAVQDWLDEQNIGWAAHDEFTGEWHACPVPIN